MAQLPNQRPPAPPKSESSSPSVSSCRTKRPRLAPSDKRIATSRRRAAPRAKSMFARFRQAMSSTAPDMPMSTMLIADESWSFVGLVLIAVRDSFPSSSV